MQNAVRLTALGVLACPKCLGSLEAKTESEDDVDEGELLCRRDDLVFPVSAGIPQLVRPERVTDLREFAQSYSHAWQKDGWGATDTNYLLNLPKTDVTRRNTGKWRVKARSMDALLSLLEELEPQRVVDLGGGVGWLSHHLARRGHEVYDVDAVLDDAIGLWAAGVYLRHGPHFERVWGELERPPFLNGSIDTVVCNASLHYASSLPTAVKEIGRILKPGGSLIVLNSPVHRDGISAVRAEVDSRRRLRQLGASDKTVSRYHHFDQEMLNRTMTISIGPTEEVSFDPGRLFSIYRRLKGLALGMELASFPILVATKSR